MKNISKGSFYLLRAYLTSDEVENVSTGILKLGFVAVVFVYLVGL